MTKEEMKNQNMDRVLKETIVSFRNNGIEGIRMGRIAQRAGVTTRTIENYFGDKENLLLQAISYYLDKGCDKTNRMENIRRSSKTGLELVKCYLEQFLLNEGAYHHEYSLLNELEQYFQKNNTAIEYVEKHIENLDFFVQHLTVAIEKGIQDGSIRKDVDILVTARTMVSTVMSLQCRFDILKRIESINEKYALKEGFSTQGALYLNMVLSYLDGRNGDKNVIY